MRMRGVRTPLLALLTLMLVALVPAPPVGAGSTFIQPGDSLNGGCTLNFAFDGADGSVYMRTAAHCVSVGQSASTSGHSNFGTVVLDDDDGLDVALIRVHPHLANLVRADVKGWPGTPTGHTLAGETAVGDVTLHSGYGLGFHFTAVTRETRVGFLVSDTASEYRLNGPNVNGDSGAPIVHMGTGKALGIISHYGIGIPPTTDAGPTIEGVLARTAALGLPVTLRTV